MGDERTTGEVPAAPDSPLAGLRERRDKAKAGLHLDLRVPRIEPPIYVRFAPLPKALVDKANRRIMESKVEDAEVIEKSVLLSHVCLGVFDVDADGKPRGNPDSWPKFDQRLAAMLELPEDCGAVTVVRELYLTDGDIVAAVAEVADWSAIVEHRNAEEYEGN